LPAIEFAVQISNNRCRSPLRTASAADGAELAKQRLDVEFDCVLGDAEPARRGLVAESIGDCGQHVGFGEHSRLPLAWHDQRIVLGFG
jgi:hypothetical protein